MYFLMIFALLCNSFLSAQAVLSDKKLDRSLEANTFPVASITIIEKGVISFVPHRQALTINPFYEGKKSREASFGRFEVGEKIFLKENEKHLFAHWGWLSDDKILIVDGKNMNVAVFSMKEQKIWRSGDIIYDLVLPFKDHGGEAPSTEIAQFRARIKKEIRQDSEIKFLHGRVVPSVMRTDYDKNATELLVQTSLSSLPFVTMFCDQEDETRCQLKRQCTLKLPAGKTYRGVAFDAQKKWLLVGEPEAHKIHILKFVSCTNQQYLKYLVAPKKLPPLSDIDVDRKERLWLSTSLKDPKTHGSVFFWEKEEWQL